MSYFAQPVLDSPLNSGGSCWAKVINGKLPSELQPHFKSSNGNYQYIGRCMENGRILVGPMMQGFGLLPVNDANSIAKPNFDVFIMSPDKWRWRHVPHHLYKIPDNAIHYGYMKSETLYIGSCEAFGIGMVKEYQDKCVFVTRTSRGDEYTLDTKFDILCRI